MFTRSSNTVNKYPRVFTYINIRLTRLHFLLRRDIFNCKDINLLSFLNNSIICFIINIYSDDHQSVLKYFKDTEVNLNNILIMTRDFNIGDNNWDLSYPHHSTYVDTLRKVANSFTLKLSMSINQVLICYTDNSQDSNLVIDLIFLQANAEEFNNHFILPDLHRPFDHAPLSVHIIIEKEFRREETNYCQE